ncbi:hypothetical protein [Aminobacter niigataensis]|uniref:hypothetical protein n=1 Tax=Aminobacter niigataensis TaxID=83265 RepID=UPI0024C7AF78|nr:hypothetical protein [Aminobacter niigataensis]CAI2933544.1 conserved exported protein of unknown function [Aminobacter niigataensis]
MKTAIALMLCGVLAACSQTTSTTSTTKTAGAPTAAAQVAPKGKAGKMTAEQRCEEAMRKATKAQTNAAMLGGALSMVGGFGGLGRGGAIAAQAASVGGSLMQAKAQDDAGKALEAECMG